MTAAGSNIRPAASLLVLRDGLRGVEVLLMRRPERGNDFRSGACVFPGGVVDAGDGALHGCCFGLDDAAASRRLGEPEHGLDFFIAALRECFEEVGLLFVCAADGSPVDLAAHAGALDDWRTRLHRGEATVGAMCEAFGWRIDLRDMAYISHWLTPAVRPKRFDTRFFVRLAPPGQQARPDFGEALELMWLTPAEALDPARGLKLLNVTRRTLDDLRPFTTARAAHDAAIARRGVARVLPLAVKTRDGRERFVIAGQPGYDEVAKLDPAGRGTVSLELEPGDATRLAPRLLRVAGVRRYAYLVTDAAGTQAAIVDADADDGEQLRVLRQAAPADVRWLLTTGDLPVDARLHAAWPQAADAAIATISIGTHTHLHAEAGRAWRLVEEATQIGGDAPLPAAEWWARASGFLTRVAG